MCVSVMDEGLWERAKKEDLTDIPMYMASRPASVHHHFAWVVYELVC